MIYTMRLKKKQVTECRETKIRIFVFVDVCSMQNVSENKRKKIGENSKRKLQNRTRQK